MNKLVAVLVMVLALPCTSFANLATKPCAQFAQGAAEYAYLSNSSDISGHEWESEIVAYLQKAFLDVVTVLVDVHASDDNEAAWFVRYEIEVDTPFCKILSLKQAHH